jgi:uncharacterized protein (TIGR02246 family)
LNEMTIKTTLLLTILTLISETCLSQNKDIEILKNLNREWINSYPTKDSETLNRIFADDFVLINHKGTKMSKNDIVSNLDKQEIISAKIDSVDVKLLTDNVGVVTAYTTFVLRSDGKEMVGQNCYQDIYMKRRGKWLAVMAHVTLLSFK